MISNFPNFWKSVYPFCIKGHFLIILSVKRQHTQKIELNFTNFNACFTKIYQAFRFLIIEVCCESERLEIRFSKLWKIGKLSSKDWDIWKIGSRQMNRAYVAMTIKPRPGELFGEKTLVELLYRDELVETELHSCAHQCCVQILLYLASKRLC